MDENQAGNPSAPHHDDTWGETMAVAGFRPCGCQMTMTLTLGGSRRVACTLRGFGEAFSDEEGLGVSTPSTLLLCHATSCSRLLRLNLCLANY